MLAKRVQVTLVLLPIGLGAIYLGGLAYLALVAVILGLASWEYVGVFRAAGFEPAAFLTVGGSLALTIARSAFFFRNPFAGDGLVLTGVVLAAMAWHLLAYERGGATSGTDFAVTVGGVAYVGLLGSYLIPLRDLPGGQWWVLVVLPAVWLADSGAYFIGKRFGRRPFSPRLSPKKTWEGYWGGVVVGPLATALLAVGWQALAGGPIAATPLRAGILALALAAITPLGDLGESMFKRQVGMKDSSNLLPGHGGALDRVDTWLWAAALGYFIITRFFV